MKIKEEEPTQAKFGMEDLEDLINKSKDPRDIAYSMLVNNLWDPSKLNMISRLDGDLTYYIAKNLIVNEFFLKYWCRAKAQYKFKKIKNPPYYQKEIIYKWPSSNLTYDKAYEEFIKTVLELTISKQGKGREEILKIIKSSDDDMSLRERAGSMLRR